MSSRSCGFGYCARLAAVLLLLTACTSERNSGRNTAAHGDDAHASVEASPGGAGNDARPIAPTALAGAAPGEAAAQGPSLVGAEPTEDQAYERARPVFEKYCAKCHTSAGGNPAALLHFSMDRYPFAGHHKAQIGSAIRRVLGASGQPATMPQDRPGAVQGDELRAMLAWADAFDRAHAASGPAEHDHQH